METKDKVVWKEEGVGISWINISLYQVGAHSHASLASSTCQNLVYRLFCFESDKHVNQLYTHLLWKHKELHFSDFSFIYIKN